MSNGQMTVLGRRGAAATLEKFGVDWLRANLDKGRRVQQQAAIDSLPRRFWSKVHKSDGCWLWIGSTGAKGHGQISLGGRRGRREAAHRVSWRLHFGDIPEGLLVCHRCDNPPCVRPDHLFLGTQGDNMRDCAQKGRDAATVHPERRPRGDAHGKARLTAEAVLAIRTAHAAGVSHYALAREHGVERTTIGAVVRRLTWTHI